MGWEGPTNRQAIAFSIWSFYNDLEPSRTDWYLMQLTAEVRSIYQGLSNISKPINLSDFKLEWKKQKNPKEKLSLEERSKLSLETWMLGATVPIKHITKDRYGNILKTEMIQPAVPAAKRRK